MADEQASRFPVTGRVIALVAAALVAFVVITTVVITRGDDDPADGQPVCPATAYLQISVAPELVSPVRSVVERLHASRALSDVDPACPAPGVTATGSADMVQFLRANEVGRPDVWIPDSSLWLRQLAAGGVTLPGEHPSLATSPIVIAVPDAPAIGTATATSGPVTPAVTPARGWDDLLPHASANTVPHRLALPQPSRLFPVASALIGLRQVAATRSTGAADFSLMVRNALTDLPVEGSLASLEAAARSGVGLPATEQQVYAYAQGSPERTFRAVYPPDGSAISSDFPYVVLTSDPQRQASAATLLADLQSETGKTALREAGLRDADGTAGSELTSSFVVDASQPTGSVPDVAAAITAVGSMDRILKGSQVLVVVDVSGSMGFAVPQAGGATRLDLALRAATAGLASYPDDTKAGLWVFSTNLTPTTDYREIVPLGPLGIRRDGTNGRQLMAGGLASMQPKEGGSTGLYDTVLAAVREVRQNWDPERVNSVILITDGANEDDNGISLPELLSTLRSENDPQQLVPLFVVAYGPSTDSAALQQIIQVTSGKVYAVNDVRAVGAIIQDAIGQRAQ